MPRKYDLSRKKVDAEVRKKIFCSRPTNSLQNSNEMVKSREENFELAHNYIIRLGDGLFKNGYEQTGSTKCGKFLTRRQHLTL
jgi:hypothetical protein